MSERLSHEDAVIGDSLVARHNNNWGTSKVRYIAALAALFIAGAVHAQGQFPTGKWQGMWVGEGQTTEVLPATIEVQSVKADDGALIAGGVTTWGDAPQWGVKAGTLHFKMGKVVGNKLTIGPGKTKIVLEYVVQADGSLQGQRIEDGKPAGTIKMKRAGN